MESEWYDCSSCGRWNKNNFSCEIHGFGALIDEVYLICGKHTKRDCNVKED